MKKKLYIVVTILLIFIISGCGSPNTEKNAEPALNSQFQSYTDNLFFGLVSSDTLTLHSYLKNPENYGITPAMPLAGYNLSKPDSCDTLSNELSTLLTFDRDTLSNSQKLTYDELKLYLENELTYSDLYLFNTSLSTTTGIQVQLPIILSEYSFAKKQDIYDYLEIINCTDSFFSNVCAFENLRSVNGLFMSDANAEQVLSQCREFISQADTGFLVSTFEKRLEGVEGISSAERNNFVNENLNSIKNHLIPAYNLLIQTVEKLKGTGKYNGGLALSPGGKEYFTYLLNRDLGWSKTPEDYNHLLDQFISSCLLKLSQTDESLPIKNTMTPDEALNDLKSRMDGVFPKGPDLPWSIKQIDSALEKYASPAMYFTPQIDNPQDNSIYINLASTDADSLYPTLAHEGYPGHMYELTYFVSTNPDRIRYLIEPGGAVEGWATYAEYWAKNNEPDIATNFLAVMCLYAKGDIGVNYFGWTQENLYDFMSKFGINDETSIKNIYNSFISAPGNYCKYTLGCLAFLTLKNKVQTLWGNSYSELEFHKQILDLGPIQFDILEKHLCGES